MPRPLAVPTHEVIRLYLDGVSQHDLAALCRVSPLRIRALLAAYDIPLRTQGDARRLASARKNGRVMGRRRVPAWMLTPLDRA